MNQFIRFPLAGIGMLALAGSITSCGDDATAATPTTVPAVTPTTSHDEHPSHQTFTIEGVDYRYDGAPSTIPAGSRLSFDNTSSKELHELVVFRLPDDIDTPLAELVGQPPEQLEATLGAPVTVMLQPPGAPEPIMAVGDGRLEEPGRYALMCFIPIGADPDEYMAAVAEAEGGKPTGVAGGPPHFTAGMFAELIVE
jgi:hypothetical protein